MLRLTDADKQSVIALANSNMNVSQAARSVFMARTTFAYHIEKVKRVSGLDPLVFYDLVKLVDRFRKEAEDGH